MNTASHGPARRVLRPFLRAKVDAARHFARVEIDGAGVRKMRDKKCARDQRGARMPHDFGARMNRLFKPCAPMPRIAFTKRARNFGAPVAH